MGEAFIRVPPPLASSSRVIISITLQLGCGPQVLLPADLGSGDLVCACNGTGIAPFRAFAKRIFAAGSAFAGKMTVITTAATDSELLCARRITEDTARQLFRFGF